MSRRWRKRIASALLILALLTLTGYVVSRGVVRFKAMVDHGSVGTDYIKSAYNSARQDDPAPLVRSAEEYSRLKSDLEHWSWLIAISNVLPTVSSQFRALEAIQDAGEDLVAARATRALPTGVFNDGRGSATALCAAAKRLSGADGPLLYSQLEEVRDELLTVIVQVTSGKCGTAE